MDVSEIFLTEDEFINNFEKVNKAFEDKIKLTGYDLEGKAKENITKETFEGVKFLKKILTIMM